MTKPKTAPAIPRVAPNNGVEMPIRGFGVFQVGPAETELSDEDMTRIATLDEGSSQFFDHRDPDMVRWLSARRLG